MSRACDAPAVLGREIRHTALASSSFDRVAAALRSRGCRVQPQRSGSLRCTCPAHPDRRPSLVVTARDGRVLLRCFAGCDTPAILAVLGLQYADLFDEAAQRVQRRRVDEYCYRDLHGAVLARKVRFAPKAFTWERPDPTARGGWRSGTGGAALPLYRWPELIDATRVLLAEGERAVEALRSRGYVATCAPHGANTWHLRWTQHLVEAGCTRLLALPDNDHAGLTHARRVAAACCRAMSVSMVALPGLPPKGDVVDYFDSGYTAEDLRRLIDGAPDWTPDGDARDRRQRTRDLARERKRRQRDRQRAATRHGADVGRAA